MLSAAVDSVEHSRQNANQANIARADNTVPSSVSAAMLIVLNAMSGCSAEQA
ncbi:MAG: hypothetical protein R3E58_19390 [Phycisphaerae bacterium]